MSMNMPCVLQDGCQWHRFSEKSCKWLILLVIAGEVPGNATCVPFVFAVEFAGKICLIGVFCSVKSGMPFVCHLCEALPGVRWRVFEVCQFCNGMPELCRCVKMSVCQLVSVSRVCRQFVCQLGV